EYHPAKIGATGRTRTFWLGSRRRRQSRGTIAREISVRATDQTPDEPAVRGYQHARSGRLCFRSIAATDGQQVGSLRRRRVAAGTFHQPLCLALAQSGSFGEVLSRGLRAPGVGKTR